MRKQIDRYDLKQFIALQINIFKNIVLFITTNRNGSDGFKTFSWIEK